MEGPLGISLLSVLDSVPQMRFIFIKFSVLLLKTIAKSPYLTSCWADVHNPLPYLLSYTSVSQVNHDGHYLANCP